MSNFVLSKIRNPALQYVRGHVATGRLEKSEGAGIRRGPSYLAIIASITISQSNL
jgi:hypothetical protein